MGSKHCCSHLLLNRPNQQIYFINMYETSWKLVFYPYFGRLEYGSAQINWAIDLHNDCSAQQKKFVLIFLSAQKKSIRHSPDRRPRTNETRLFNHVIRTECYPHIVPLSPGAPDLTHVICLWFLIFVFSLGNDVFFLSSRSWCSFLNCAFQCSMLHFQHLD
jgi:hypothetical protein